jgi:hypothetical protein
MGHPPRCPALGGARSNEVELNRDAMLAELAVDPRHETKRCSLFPKFVARPSLRRVECSGYSARLGSRTDREWPCRRARSRVSGADPPDGDAELASLVGEIALDSGSWEHHDANRQRFEQRVVAPERRGLGVLGPIRLKAIWGRLRATAHLDAINSAPFGDPPCMMIMSGYLASVLSSRSQIRR